MFFLLRALRNLIVALVGRFGGVADRMEQLVRRVLPAEVHPFPGGVLLSLLKRVQPVFLDYPVNTRPRWGFFGQAPHPQLAEMLEAQVSDFATLLESFHPYAKALGRIPRGPEDARPEDPTWVNDWFGGLDGVALYVLVAELRPRTFVEIGSGMSTKFVRRSIRDNDSGTRIVSIDPVPRAEIDALCDVQIRQPLEELDLRLFEELQENDIVFLDGSHRVFMNSDVTVFFLEVLPRLPRGVYVQMHDIFLPWDYLPEWAGRYYSEQYMLAAYLMGGGRGVDVVLPCTFAWMHPKLASLLAPLCEESVLGTVPLHGASFWMRTTGDWRAD